MRVVFIQVKNGLLACACLPHEFDRGGGRLVVDGLHTLRVERPGIFADLFANPAPMRLFGRIVSVGRLAS